MKFMYSMCYPLFLNNFDLGGHNFTHRRALTPLCGALVIVEVLEVSYNGYNKYLDGGSSMSLSHTVVPNRHGSQQGNEVRCTCGKG